ncbi:excalibur calcium-binding domain-containing protein [Muribacter muris]|uniref:Excalibur calcium-binding domain-containing protein n=1 Tax=Muribacter muris TaxID=67855 RepID=A0A4Y9JRP2_9PAST|nr:excalibur calcium-binding domain-containing protein [Muribacter muris]MBF0786217.1 excalibur calcium-binding domain-containing protein [Muribacter muris]MBF0826450.1 excalibur calcium-binding domain-containing protein [Muribacter muris]TFV07579.1 excalibur calcium-binding domain-containing protein [Muribacter muris]
MKKYFTLIISGLFAGSAWAYSCDTPAPYCKAMASCEQARFYLNQCGVHRLDRDNDGIPCENVCGKSGKKTKSAKTTKSKVSKTYTKKKRSGSKRVKRR